MESAGKFVEHLFKQNGHRGPMKSDYLREDVRLSEHFSLYELTITSNKALQERNRILSDEQVEKLKTLAEHAEAIRTICEAPVIINSGYRGEVLNIMTLGSSSTSQHPRCEAMDFYVKGMAHEEVFNRLLDMAKQGRFKFGQLILERAARSYGTAVWIHCSVIGTLDPSKVGQAMIMNAGIDGKQHYKLVEQVKFT